MDPWDHFVAFGFLEGRDPHPLFHSSWYLTSNGDVAASGIVPIAHYIASGASERRAPHPLVAPSWLRSQLALPLPHDNPLLGYIAAAPAIGPRPIFDVCLMRDRLDLAACATGPEAMSAWLSLDPGDRPDPHWLIDSAFIGSATGLSRSDDPLRAYIECRGRCSSPHPLFDNDYVWTRHSFLHGGDDELTLLERAITSERMGEIDGSPLFDRDFYERAMPREARARQPALLHYLSDGGVRGLDPNPLFDEAAYRERYLRDAPATAGLAHYAMSFRQPHVTLAPRFPDRFYVGRYPEIADRSYQASPLDHYLRFGRQEGRRISEPLWCDDFADWDEVRRGIKALARPPAPLPSVSIIIAAYNQFHFTLRCVWSLLIAGGDAAIQIIVADDGSTDETQAFFSDIPGLTYVRNRQNVGFLRTCNTAARHAVAPYILFLNNDTAVLPGSVRALLETAEALPDAGLIGAKLVYPDGTLQEAGGYIWNDGTGANLGRYGDPEHAGFNLRRDADYISGAAILVRRALWERIGGFDKRYAPAYCEDSDLAMRVRALGWRVVYEPTAQVVHFEGVSSGTSTAGGVKAYQTVNQRKLLAKWRFALEGHLPSQVVGGEHVPRPPRPRILVIDAIVPEPKHDAGSVTQVWYLRLLTELGYEVSFLPENLLFNGRWGAELRAIGVGVLHRPYVRSVHDYLEQHAADYDAILLYRVTVASTYIEQLRRLCLTTRLIFDTVDLHFLRAEREAARLGIRSDAAADLRARELRVMELADETILLSQQERQVLRDMGHRGKLSVIPLVLENKADIPPRKGRTGIAFVGGFQHAPNVDAVTYFMEEIYPLLAKAAPEIEVHIVGSKPPAAILQIDAPGVMVHGFVDDLDGFLDQRIATIAPLRYGAGIKGKIGSSLAAGVPVVSTAVGAEGMGLQDGRDLLVADSPADFVSAIQRLCRDDALWKRLSKAGQAFVEDNYSARVTRHRLLRLLASANVAPFLGHCPITGRVEERRFLDERMADSLSALRGTSSSERVLAHAMSTLSGEPDRPLCRIAKADLPAIVLHGDLPVLAAAAASFGFLDQADVATVALARVVQDDEAVEQLGSMLDGLPDTVSRLILACPAAGKTPTGRRLAPEVLMTLVETLEASGWEVRCTQLPLKECAITDVPQLEARRRGALPRQVNPA